MLTNGSSVASQKAHSHIVLRLEVDSAAHELFRFLNAFQVTLSQRSCRLFTRRRL